MLLHMFFPNPEIWLASLKTHLYHKYKFALSFWKRFVYEQNANQLVIIIIVLFL